MTKIQLSIKVTYLPTWGAWEGIRELVQNGRDAETEFGAPLSITWSGDKLIIENEGTTVPTKALLLGHTTKAGHSELIGKFGEGLKLGILALVRAGHVVKIRNGGELWLPIIERSKQFDEDVLTFKIQKAKEAKNRVRIEVHGISEEDWNLMKGNFLFLNQPKPADAVETFYGTLLLGEVVKGRVFVKGIFVQHDPELTFGYNFNAAELDRDRKMVASWNLKYNAKNILLQALTKREDLFPQFDRALQEQSTEMQSLDSDENYLVPDAAAKFVSDKFVALYGENAIPVSSLAESMEVEHLGKRGVVVNKNLCSVLSKTLGELASIKDKIAKEELRIYGWSELEDQEKENLINAITCINAVTPLSIEDINVSDFRSDGLMGLYSNGKISVAKKFLVDPEETLAILIHEVAHKRGGDGHASHVQTIENIWMCIVRNLRKSQ